MNSALAPDLIVIAGDDDVPAHIPADCHGAAACGSDGSALGLRAGQQAGGFGQQGRVFGQEFLELQAQGGLSVGVLRLGC